MSYEYTLIVKFRYKTDERNNDYAVIYNSIKDLLLDEGFVETNTTSELLKYYECKDKDKIRDEIVNRIKELTADGKISTSTALNSYITVDEQKVIKETRKSRRTIHILGNNLDWIPFSTEEAYEYFKIFDS